MNTPNDYELIATLALGLRDAAQASDAVRARLIAATLAQAVHTAVVLPYRLDRDDAPAATTDPENIRQLLAAVE